MPWLPRLSNPEVMDVRPERVSGFLQAGERESGHKAIKHKLLRVPVIAPIGELGNVLPHMLSRDVDVSAAHGALEMSPMPFNRIRMVDASNPLLLTVVDAAKFKISFQVIV